MRSINGRNNLQAVFINSLGNCLPGNAVSNEEMEAYIGKINQEKSRLGPIVLRHNKIQQRYYAINRDGSTSWTAASLVAEALKEAIKKSELNFSEIEFLATATTQSDLMVPGFASMVQAELGLQPIEIASFQSVCASSMMALKNAHLQVKAGEHKNALVGAGEFASRFFRPGFYEGTNSLDAEGKLPLSAEFLRWTLSDGAGGLVLENQPNQHKHSLEIEWIHLKSFAGNFKPCMYAGSKYREEKPWSHYGSPKEAFKEGAMVLQQDFDILQELLPVWVGEYAALVESGKIPIKNLDWFLCHYSTHHLRVELIKLLKQAGCMVPEEKWFSNLAYKGNTGTASIFVMLEELFYEKTIQKGQKILCIVPESGRSIIAFMLLKVV
ncbi:MAG: 3-oxoacyl-[acyl-carrier-protein] synthase III C-terminal domain-containing protein [Candidatus Caenarcaniphilales bacterium]|nr:3-oxoacyl-[acyl-carrier-protein] synthase III C-terminal domain-containing protein [Candidatus Caenarcaniphilales bacterium]